MMRSLHVAVALMLMPAALAQHPVMEIKVAGNERLAGGARIAPSGFRKGPEAALAQHPVMEIRVAGKERRAAPAVIAASGLRKGQMATRAELDAAAQKLADTGFFTSVSYRYDPKAVGGVTGYALTFQVSEQPALAPVELDIPGQDAEHLWQQLKTADGFMD